MTSLKQILIASGNKNKVFEIKNILKDLGIKILSLKDFPLMPEVIEDAKTLEGNAIKKALETAKFTKEICLADDSGLEVDYLAGAPGVYSARYAGENVNYNDNNKKLLKELENVPKEKRQAKFRTVMALAFPNGNIKISRGECKGFILEELKGDKGFGYDPLFFIAEINKSLAEISIEEKNKISHRAKALKEMFKIIKNIK